jgi:hypothetical protein
VQYGGLSHGLRRGPVEEIPLSQFSQGRTIWIRLHESSELDRDEVVRRARLRLGENRYHVLTNNFEHFCEWCVCGEHRSYQVDEFVARYGRAWRRLIVLLARAPVSAQRFTRIHGILLARTRNVTYNFSRARGSNENAGSLC